MQSFNREDYIHRLEQDNERLKQIILGNEMEITAKDETIDQLQKVIKDLEWQIKQILEDNESYQKENAELEVRVENQKSFLKRIRAKFNLGAIDRKEIEGYLEGKQLTKAKEIIEKLLPYAKTGKHDKQDLQSIDRFCESIHEAELFFKESE